MATVQKMQSAFRRELSRIPKEFSRIDWLAACPTAGSKGKESFSFDKFTYAQMKEAYRDMVKQEKERLGL